MVWKKMPFEDTARYSVSLSTTNSAESVLLGHKTSKMVASTIVQKVAAAFAIVMLFVIGFSGAIATSKPAQANMFQDAIDGICAGSGSYGYGAVDKNILSPNTVPEAGTLESRFARATPYEKYGMSGTEWTTWVGFTPEPGKISDKDHAGSGSSGGLIALIGGNSKEANLTQWEAQTKDKERDYPGLFNVTNECAAFSASSVPTQLGNLLLGTGKIATWLSGYAYQTAAESSSNIYEQMEKPVEAIVTAMKDKLYFAYLTPMIMIGALWMAYVGLFKRQATTALAGLAWSLAAIIASVAFMTKPMLIPETANSIVSGISQGGMSSITSYTTNDKNNMCNARPHDSTEEDSRTTIRSVQCNMWYAFTYTPWVIGQFGVSPSDLTAQEKKDANGFINRVQSDNGTYVFRGNGLDLKVLTTGDVSGDDVSTKGLKLQRTQIAGKAAPESEQNWALHFLDHRSNWDNAPEPQKLNKVRAQLQVSANQLAPSNYNADFRGDNGETRIGMGLLALAASLGGGVMITFISVSLIVLDIGIIILALISPLFFLAALHPGAGRQIAMGWVEMIIKMSLKRIALSIFLAIMVAIFGVLIQSSKDMEWAIAMILIVALAIGGMTYQRQISEMFNSFSLGGRQMQTQPIPGQQSVRRFVRNKQHQANNATKRMMHNAGENLKSNLKRGVSGAGVAGGAGAAPASAMTPEQAAKDEAMRRTLEQRGLLNGGAGEAPNGELGGPDGTSPNPNDPNSPSLDGGAGAAPLGDEVHEVQSTIDGQQTEAIDSRGVGVAQIDANEQPDGDTENGALSGAGVAPLSNVDIHSEDRSLEAPQFNPDGTELASHVDPLQNGGAGAAPVIAAGGVAAAVAERKEKRKQVREEKAVARNERAIQRERRNLTNASRAEGGSLHVATRDEAIASLEAKRAEAQTKRDQRLRHINSVKRGTMTGAQALQSTGQRAASVGRQAFVEPTQEFSNMVNAFKEDTVRPAVAHVQALPMVKNHMEQRQDAKDFKNAYRKNLEEVKNEAKQPAIEAKAKEQEFRKDMKSFKGNREARRVYAAAKYGRTPQGQPLEESRSTSTARQTIAPNQEAPKAETSNTAPRAASAPAVSPSGSATAPSNQAAPAVTSASSQPKNTSPAPAQGNATPANQVAPNRPASTTPVQQSQPKAQQAPRPVQAPQSQPKAQQAPRPVQAPQSQPKAQQAPRPVQAPQSQPKAVPQPNQAVSHRSGSVASPQQAQPARTDMARPEKSAPRQPAPEQKPAGNTAPPASKPAAASRFPGLFNRKAQTPPPTAPRANTARPAPLAQPQPNSNSAPQLPPTAPESNPAPRNSGSSEGGE